MSAADNGGWDLAIEIATNALSGALSSLLPSQLPPRPVPTPAFQGTVTPRTSVTGVTLSTAADLTASVSMNGTVLRVTNLAFPPPGVGNPPPPWLSDITIDGVVRVTDRLEMRANALVIDFTPTPVLNQPAIVAELDEDSVLKAPLVQFVLADVFRTGGQAAYEQARALLLQTIRTDLERGARDAVVALGAITLIPPPAVPLQIRASDLRAAPASLHVLYAMGVGGTGNTSLITRSMLLTSSVTGAPVDVAAISLSNASLLRDFLREGLMGPPLGLPAGGFLPGHPCFFVGPVTIPLPGGTVPGITRVRLNSLIAGIDEAGLFHVVIGLDASGSAGAFSITASVDNSFAFGSTTSGGVLTITVTPVIPPSVSSNVDIAWWMYVAGALAGGLTFVGVLAAVDVFAGRLLDGAIATAIGGGLSTITAPIPLPGSVPPPAVRVVRSTQADAPTRTVTLAGNFTVPDPFRSHDLIVNLV